MVGDRPAVGCVRSEKAGQAWVRANEGEGKGEKEGDDVGGRGCGGWAGRGGWEVETGRGGADWVGWAATRVWGKRSV